MKTLDMTAAGFILSRQDGRRDHWEHADGRKLTWDNGGDDWQLLEQNGEGVPAVVVGNGVVSLARVLKLNHQTVDLVR